MIQVTPVLNPFALGTSIISPPFEFYVVTSCGTIDSSALTVLYVPVDADTSFDTRTGPGIVHSLNPDGCWFNKCIIYRSTSALTCGEPATEVSETGLVCDINNGAYPYLAPTTSIDEIQKNLIYDNVFMHVWNWNSIYGIKINHLC